MNRRRSSWFVLILALIFCLSSDYAFSFKVQSFRFEDALRTNGQCVGLGTSCDYSIAGKSLNVLCCSYTQGCAIMKIDGHFEQLRLEQQDVKEAFINNKYRATLQLKEDSDGMQSGYLAIIEKRTMIKVIIKITGGCSV